MRDTGTNWNTLKDAAQTEAPLPVLVYGTIINHTPLSPSLVLEQHKRVKLQTDNLLLGCNIEIKLNEC